MDIVFTFGKYKGKLIDDIIKSDPQYVAWAFSRIEWFELADDQIKNLHIETQKDYIHTAMICGYDLLYDATTRLPDRVVKVESKYSGMGGNYDLITYASGKTEKIRTEPDFENVNFYD